jgi:hypothetical protein
MQDNLLPKDGGGSESTFNFERFFFVVTRHELRPAKPFLRIFEGLWDRSRVRDCDLPLGALDS